MHGLALAVGAVAAVLLGRAARRARVRSRIVGLRTRAVRRLPARVREPLAAALRDVGADLTPEQATGLVGLAALVAAGAAAVLAPPLAVPAGLGVLVAAPVGLGVVRGRAQRAYAAALPVFVEHAAGRLRAGHTVATALRDAARDDGPLAGDARRVGQWVAHGRSLVDALGDWASERRTDATGAVAGALTIAVETGGAAAPALDGLARSLRDQVAARADVAAWSAQARLSAVVVGCAPVAFLGFGAAVDPSTVTLLVTSGIGRLCLVAGLVLDGLGVVWMRRIVRSEP